MLAILTSFILLLAGSGGGGFTQFYNEWFNIPGFELWKFVNLAIFIGLLIHLLRKPLGDAFKAKREQIRSELIKAEQEKQAALSRLTKVEAKLAQLENEKESVLAKAKEEAEIEKKRLAEQTKAELERLRGQSSAEITRLANLTRADLRRLSAEESIRLAEAKLRAQIDGATDARLVKASISEMGGLN